MKKRLYSFFTLLISLFFLPIDSNAQVVIQLGSGENVTGTTTASPVNINYRSRHYQIVYTAEELLDQGAQAGSIQRIGFYVDSAPIYPIPSYSIKMKHTTAVNAAVHDSGELTELYLNASYAPLAGGFDTLTLDNPFFWNGTDNILIDICHDLVVPNYNASGTVRFYSVTNGMRFSQNDGTNQCDLPTTSTSSAKPQILIEFADFADDDAAVISLDEPGIFCAGEHDISVTIANYGNITLNNVQVNWEFDGVAQTPVNYNMAIPTIGDGTNTASVSLGSKNFISGQVYNLKVWTSGPNGQADEIPANDTLNVARAPGLEGNYTVGGANPDFEDFAEMANALNLYGICGNTTFNVRSGTYSEQIRLGEIPGTDSLSQITIQSESGDSSDVVLTHSSDFNDNYTLLLDGTDWITIQNLTVEATDVSNARAVVFQNQATHINFYNNALRGVSSNFTGNALAVVYSFSNDVSEYISFKNNLINQGSYGILMDGNFSNRYKHLEIHTNQFQEQYAYGIFMDYCDTLSIQQNLITSQSGNNFYYGIYTNNTYGKFNISKNQVFDINGGYGIYVGNADATAANQVEVQNNFVHIKGNQASYGIFTSSGTYQRFAFNSVNITNTHEQSRAFYNSFGSQISLINNIFSTSGAGYAIYTNSTSSIVSSDYNDLYSAGNVGYFNADINSFNDWQAVTGLDSNSVSVIPLFVADTSFQVVQIGLNGRAMPIPDITSDIEGDIRDASNPDIGADEFDPPAVDAGLNEIVTEQFPFPSGNQTIQAELKNFGTDPLTSVVINWQVNEVNQPAVNWNGNLVSDATIKVDLGNVNFVLGQEYSITASTSNPNNMQDIVIVNDTAKVDSLYAGLGGEYTIGGAAPDFETIDAAVLILKHGGVFAETTFSIRSGNYAEQIVIGSIPGSDSLKTVTITSETGTASDVVWTFSSSNFSQNYTVLLDGTSWLTIDNLTIEATHGSNGRVIEWKNGANNNTFSNLIIKGIATSSSSSAYALVYSGDFESYNQVFTKNNFVNGSYGIYCFGSFSGYVRNLNIEENTFQNPYTYAIYLDDHETSRIHGNTIYGNPQYNFFVGIYLNSCRDGFEVTSNSITKLNNGRGIYLNSLFTSNMDSNLIANNYIQISGDQLSYGIWSDFGSGQNIVYNSINMSNTHEDSRAIYIESGSTGSKVVLNNILSNTGGGFAIYIDNLNSIISSDYNDIYSSGQFIGYAGNNVSTLEDWQLGTSFDGHSISENPLFLSDSSYQVTQIALNGAAMPLNFVTDDIEGDPRDMVNPDIGADEFDPPPIDAGVSSIQTGVFPFPEGQQKLFATVKNFGTEALGNLTLQWEVNGNLQQAVSWSGALFSNDTTSIELGTVDFEVGQAYAVKAWSENPNNQADQVAANDSFIVNDLYAGLGGQYSIGPGSDFEDFNEAVTALNNGGVVAPVFFNVSNGTYIERIRIRNFPGADSTRMVTFQSASGDSSLVKLTYESDFNTNYTVNLDQASWITFRKLTFEATDNFYARIIYFTDGTHHINFKNNLFLGLDGSPSSTSNAIIHSEFNESSEYLCFTNNHFKNGSVGIYLDSPFNNGNYNRGVKISYNTFEDQYYRGIYLFHQESPVVSFNDFTTDSGSFSYTGILLTTCDEGGIISENVLRDIDIRYGIYLSSVNGTSENPFLVSNNFVHMTGNTTDVTGIYTSGGSFQLIAHNSVHLRGMNTFSRAFYNSFGENKTVLNNIFANTGEGLSYYNSFSTFGDISGVVNSDHNDLYSAGSMLGYWNADVIDFATWQATSGKDLNSVNISPAFVSDSDLHLMDVNLDKLGTAVAEVPLDIDGETRDPVKPDIGADEFSTANNDAGVVSIDSPVKPFAADLQDIYVTLFNNGLQPLNNVAVNWEVNGLEQTPVNFNETIPSGSSQDSILIGSFTFELNTAYSIQAWTTNPNGMLDEDMFNDTARVDSLYAGLGGVYTIGGAAPDFESFDEAVKAMINGGIVDQVAFNARAGEYEEQIVIPEIMGVTSERPVTFQSEDGDSTGTVLKFMSASDANYTVKLDGADWIRFYGLTIEAINSSYGRVVEISNGATNNEFGHNIIKGPAITNFSTNNALVYSSGTDDRNNLFSGNVFENGSYGFYWLGNSNFEYESGTRITGNLFSNQYYRAMLMQLQDSPFIMDNECASNSNSSSYIGLYCLSNIKNIRVISNYFHDISQGTAIRIESSTGNVGQAGLIANNFIQIGDESLNCNGIHMVSSSNINIYYNSVNVTSSSTTASAFRSETSGGNDRLLNNIFANTGGGLAFYNNNVGIAISNFNNLYTTGSLLGSWNTTNATDLAEWQSLSGLDANSLSTDPLFVSATDLHIEEVDLNGAAQAIADVTNDFDGEERDASNPDIGADEFMPIVQNDAGISEFVQPNPDAPFPGGVQDVRAVIRNNGSDNISSATIQWRINNIAQPAVSWNGLIMPGERDTVVLGSFDFKVGAGHDILAYTENPNGMPDLQPSNDTLSATGLFPALDGIYTLGGQFPDFNTLAEAVSALNNGGVLGLVNFQIRNGIYSEQLVIGKVDGASEVNTVTFESESGIAASVSIEYMALSNSTNYVVKLDGSRYISFKNLTLRSNHPSYATVVNITNQAGYNSLIDNIIESPNSATAALILSDQSFVNSNQEVSGNTIEGGGYGVYFYGLGNSLREQGNIIQNNQFFNQRYSAILLRYQDDVQCIGNEISSNSADVGFTGISTQLTGGEFEISKNKITGSIGHGIRIDRHDGSQSEPGLVSNNFVHVQGSQLSYGIYTYGSSYVYVYNNSIHVTNTHAFSRAYYNIYGDDNNVINNILANSGGGYAYYNGSFSGIGSSNFNDLYTTGLQLGNWSGVNVANLQDWRTETGKDNNSVSVDPLFSSNTDLHVFQSQLDSMGTSLSLITDDIDGDSRDPSHPDIGADEFSYILDDVGISALVAPMSGCGLSNNESISVEIQNFSGLSLSGFNVAIQLGQNEPIVENVGNLNIPSGQTKTYDFNATFDLSTFGDYEITAYTMLPDDTNLSNDTLKTTVSNLVFPSGVQNMIPADGTSGLSTTIAFSWSPSDGATKYDIYIWLASQARPQDPVADNINDISYLYSNASLLPGESYNWQVIAKNDYCSTEGPVQSFSLFDLPDLVITNVQIPDDAFSGREIEVRWDVTNMGEGSTGMTQWIDAVYLSEDAILDLRFDQYLGGFSNASALLSGESYSNMAMVTLPEGLSATYYIFIWTDRYNRLREEDEDNNTGRSFGEMTVTLTPPPDLEVTSIVSANNAFSGSDFDVMWTVTNTGAGNTRSAGWTDRIYFSDSDTLDVSTATLFGQQQYNGMLKVDSSYTEMVSGKIPDAISGLHYIHVTTDVFNQEYEFASDGNNTSVSTPINIILIPPPDLVVTNIMTPTSANNQEMITVEWIVENQGGSETEALWQDKVYLSSQSSSPDLEQALFLGAKNRITNLSLGENYTNSLDFTVPGDIAGAFYIYVVTDANNNVFEFNNEGNNQSRSSQAVMINHADLEANNVVLSVSEAESGDSITVSWDLKNSGPGDLVNREFSVGVFVSDESSFNSATAMEVYSMTSQSSLNSGQSNSFNQKFMLPHGISGQYYVYVFADSEDQIFENNQESNNVNDPGIGIDVELAPWVDLNPVSIPSPDSVNAGATIILNYTIRNTGTKDAVNLSWNDKIYISSSSIYNPDQLRLIRVLSNTKDIAIGSETEIETTVTIPLNLLTGNYYIHLLVDSEDDVYEYTGESNNRIATAAILVKGYPAIDLAVTNVTHATEANTGQEINIQWTVDNLSENPTIALAWIDAIYLSSDIELDRTTDLLLTEEERSGLIAAGESYSDQTKVRIPNGLSGDYYLIIYTDNTFLHNDYDQSNNSGYTRDGQQNILPISIQLTPPPDLVVNAFSSVPQATAGQPIEIRYTVLNNGQGPTVVNAWTDRVYLSTDFTLDNSDRIVASFAHKGVLNPGEFYSDTVNVNIPINISGNRILIIKTDVNNTVYEFNSENNNTANASIDIFEAPPSDLVITNIVIPASAKAGEEVTVQWTLKNEGENPAAGYMQEAVYFSKDEIWDIGDVLFGKETININLAPEVSLNREMKSGLSGVAVGDFYVIVRTDVLNNITESDDTNNQLVSESTVNVDVEEIFIGMMKADTLENNKPLFYRIEIPSNLIGESLLTSIVGDTIFGNNELYMRYGNIPTRVDFDYSFGESFSGKQEVIIPELQEGTYYILVYGNSFAGNSQAIEIMASILNFEIRRIDDNKGGNSGNVTIRIDGSKFDEGMTMSLENGSIITASNVMFVDPTRVFATFDLNGKAEGKYDVVARKDNGESAIMMNAFEIIQGEAPSIVTNVTHPGSTRRNRIVTMRVDYTNDGNVDITNPMVILESLGGAPFSLTLEGLEDNETEVELKLLELNGPPGILRPGASGTITVYVKAIAPILYVIILPEFL